MRKPIDNIGWILLIKLLIDSSSKYSLLFRVRVYDKIIDKKSINNYIIICTCLISNAIYGFYLIGVDSGSNCQTWLTLCYNKQLFMIN